MNVKLIAVIVSIVVIGGGGGYAIYRSLSEPTTNASLGTQKQANVGTGVTAPSNEGAETCSPPGTPTCDPSGHVVGASAPSGANQAGLNQSTSSVKTIDGDIGLKKVSLSGTAPQGLDVDLKSGLVYIGNNGNIIAGCEGDVTKQGNMQAQAKPFTNTLSIVDPASGKEVASPETESGAIWTQVDNKNNVVYVAGSGNGKIGIHELATGKKKSAVTVGGKPHAFGYDPETNILITSNTNDTTQTYMSAINTLTSKLIAAHKAPELPHGISVDTAKGLAYMVGVKNGDIAVIDMKTGEVKETKSPLTGQGNGSNMMAFSAKSRLIFVSDTRPQSSVTVVNADTWKEVGKLSFSNTTLPVWGMQVDDATGLLYAAMPQANAVGVADIKTLKPLGLVPVDTCPYAVRLDFDRGLGFTTSMVNNTLSIFDLKKVRSLLKIK